MGSGGQSVEREQVLYKGQDVHYLSVTLRAAVFSQGGFPSVRPYLVSAVHVVGEAEDV